MRKGLQVRKKPSDIPSNPDKAYKNKGWIDWGDWVGTGRVANKKKEYWTFEEARAFVHSLGLKSVSEWKEYYKSHKPAHLPHTPSRQYKNKGWISWPDWLGTDTVAPQNKQYRSFKEAKEFVHELGLASQSEWFEYTRFGSLPPDIPIAPHLSRQYKNEWKGWGDWLGTWRKATQEAGWSIEKVKQLSKSLIESGIIYQWSEARLYRFLLTKGILNLKYENKHNQFFKNLIEATHTQEGRKVIEDYAYSDSEVAPDLLKKPSDLDGNEIQSASTEELARLVNDNSDPLDYGEIPTVEQVLASTSVSNQLM